MNAFHLIRSCDLPDYKGRGHIFEHRPTGARLLHIECDDDDKVFAVSFRTLPESSNGIAHILEHSVLCGSERFPVKEPFVDLMRSSLATFLNAMTYDDRTVYPVSSRNARDFENLFEVYFDAVFHPLIDRDPLILKQEGWHYEFDEAGELIINGVVYNEMRGALSDPREYLQTEAQKLLCAGGHYGVNSGGEAREIPNLRQEEFLDFHRRYYHPSNACFFFYGDMDIEHYLERLSELLQTYDRGERFGRARLGRPVEEELYLELPVVAEKEDEDGFALLSFLTCDRSDTLRAEELSFLCFALCHSEISPLKYALQHDPDLSLSDVSMYVKTSIDPLGVEIFVSGLSPASRPLLREKIFAALEKISREGFDQKYLDSMFSVMSFSLLESGQNNFHRGIIAGLSAMNSWPEGGDPFAPLKLSETLERLKKGLSSERLCTLLRTALLENPARIFAVTEAAPSLAAENLAREKERLAELRSRLTEEEIHEIRTTCEGLARRREEPDSEEARASLPVLSLADLPEAPEKIEIEVNEDGEMYYEAATAGIRYQLFEFDASDIDDRYALSLLAESLSRFPTQKRDEKELRLDLMLSTGGFSCSLNCSADRLSFNVETKWLPDHAADAIELIREILSESDFASVSVLKRVLLELNSELESRFTNAGHALTLRRIAAQSRGSARALDDCTGLAFFDSVQESLSSDKTEADLEALCLRLRRVAEQLFCRSRLLCHACSDGKERADVDRLLLLFRQALPLGSPAGAIHEAPLPSSSEAVKVKSEVQYVGQGGNFLELGLPWDGRLPLIKNIVSQAYLWQHIRVAGGAYGAMTSLSPKGDLACTSYRDPKLEESWKVYDGIPHFLETFTPSQDELNGFIIGTLREYMTVLPPFSKALSELRCRREGFDYERRLEDWKAILHATPAALAELAVYYRKVNEQGRRCCVGSSEAIEAAKDRFDKIRTLRH